MKPKTYWASLNTDERAALAAATGKSKPHLANIFTGMNHASLPFAKELADHCDGLIDPLDLVSPENRKAVKAIAGK